LNLLVDTSVRSLALRRDAPPDVPEVDCLEAELRHGGRVFSTGLILQELLQGFSGARNWDAIVSQLSKLPFITPDREDHVAAAQLRSSCRRKGTQVGTIDALLAQLCVRYELTMLTTDQDFLRIADLHPLRVWRNG